jgi:hypothetical protein
MGQWIMEVSELDDQDCSFLEVQARVEGKDWRDESCA